jgi:hypothetical protein
MLAAPVLIDRPMTIHRARVCGKGDFSNYIFFMCGYFIQNCFICHPSDSKVSEDAENEPRTVRLRHRQSVVLSAQSDLVTVTFCDVNVV